MTGLLLATALAALPPDRVAAKPYLPSPRTTDTNTWYGARMAEKRAEIAASGGAFDIVFVGDSITHFWEPCSWFSPDGSSETAALKKKYSILNLGFAGDGTEHVLWRLGNGQADGYTAKCMVLMIGTNNKAGPVEDVARGVGAIIDLWKKKHPESTVVLVSVLPRDVCPGDPMRRRMERLNALTESCLDGKRVWRIDLNDRFLTPDGFLKLDLFSRDRVHLSPAGYRVWREALEPVFDQLAGDTRPYEFIDADRVKDEIAPWIGFESAHDAWRAEPAGKASAVRSSERMLFGKKTLKVTFAGAGEVRIRPSAPLPLPAAHDWFGSWIRNDGAFATGGAEHRRAPAVSLVFRAADGREKRLPLRNYYGKSMLNWLEWWYVVRRFSSAEKTFLDSPGVTFDGFALTACSNTVPRTVYIDNIAFFNRDETTPLAVPAVPAVPIPTRSEGARPASAARYSQASAAEILYLLDDGSWQGVSGAVLSGDRELQRIAVRYTDGTCVVANGHRAKRMAGRVFGRDVDLPPCGYRVWNDARGLEIDASDRTGARADYSASADAVYLDTRSAQGPVAFARARGKGIAVCRREGDGWEVIPVRGDVSFRVPGSAARAYGESREDLGPASLTRDADGFVRITPVPGAFSYLIDGEKKERLEK